LIENAATRGDVQGTIPVAGRYTLGLMGINNNSTPDYSMFEMDVVAV